MKHRVIVTVVAVATLALATVLPSSAANPSRTPRGGLVHDLVLKWGPHVAEAYGMDPREWAMELVPLFSRVPLARLEQARRARSFEAMNDALLAPSGAGAASTASAGAGAKPRVTARALGDVATDLVFVPVTPCRIIDTRVAGGAIAANTTRAFDVAATATYAGQGGEASDCNGVGSAGNFAAAAINFIAVTPSAGGYITAFPFGATQPLASTLNYTAGSVVANQAIVRLDQGAASSELSVYSFAQTHLVADIVGYFIAPQATALECVEKVSAVGNIAGGGSGSRTTPSCDAGYTITGGSCSMSTYDGRVVTSRTVVSGSSQTHFCAFRNEGAATVEAVAYARCCRIPGRP